MRGLFYTSADDLLSAESDRLNAIIGLPLVATWIAWDLSAESWFADEPVILQFGNVQIELTHYQLDHLAVTWNTIDTAVPPNWLGCWEGWSLQWRRDTHPVLVLNVGRLLRGVSVVEMYSETTVVSDPQHPQNIGLKENAWLLHAIEFEFDNAVTAIFNALDENGIQAESHSNAGFRRRSISGKQFPF